MNWPRLRLVMPEEDPNSQVCLKEGTTKGQDKETSSRLMACKKDRLASTEPDQFLGLLDLVRKNDSTVTTMIAINIVYIAKSFVL